MVVVAAAALAEEFAFVTANVSISRTNFAVKKAYIQHKECLKQRHGITATTVAQVPCYLHAHFSIATRMSPGCTAGLHFVTIQQSFLASRGFTNSLGSPPNNKNK